jgi:predicted dehydrogenase
MPMIPSRRTFLASSAVGVATTLTRPAPAEPRANKALRIGLIGCGHRGRVLIREVIKLKHLVVALCDVAEFRREEVAASVVKADQPQPELFADYRKLLEMNALDAVIIATPEHHHHDQCLAALASGYDVYLETPLSKTIDEGKAIVDAVRRTKRIVQVGNQRRSGPHWKKCREIIESHDFGSLVWAKTWETRNWFSRDPFGVPEGFSQDAGKSAGINWQEFLGRAAKRPFDAQRYWAWRWYWEYAGGLMTDLGAHHLDLIHWLGGVNGPKSVIAHGGTYQFKSWETPDVLHGVWDYGSFTATLNMECVNGAEGVGAAFYGTKQTLIIDADKDVRLYQTIDKLTPDTEPRERWTIEPETPLHVKNWLECCLSRKEPNAPIELGHQAMIAAHLANLSYRTGKRMYWNAERQEIIGS